MSKVSGSYESVVRGVSEQVPQDRLSGQHTEQVNMISDPVAGLARRQGSEMLTEVLLAGADFQQTLANTASHRTHSFRSGGKEYDLLYRTAARPYASAVQDALFCYDRDAAQFIPIQYDPTAGAGAAALSQFTSGGVSAIVQVGRYTLATGNTLPTTWSEEDRYGLSANRAALAVWVRGGAYSRTFSIVLTEAATGIKRTVSYKTAASSYPTLLDTSDLLTSDPDYQKKVNDRVYAYNSQVTKWIGTASEDITPANIAAKLAAAYTAAGYGTITQVGSTLIVSTSFWSDLTVNDGGDQSLMVGVGNAIDSTELLCPVHKIGKIVKVRPSQLHPELAFYMEAYAKDEGVTGYAEVTWKETAGTRFTPGTVFVMLTVEAGTLLVSTSASWLEAHVGSTDEDVPKYDKSIVGDALTSPLPAFLGKRVDYLGLFQDRLVIGAGAVIFMSRTGDYFNWFRKSSLTLVDDDPIELFSLGSEEDTIKFSTVFNRDLILYGEQGQYAISGKQVATPRSASIVAFSKHEGGQDTPPLAAGNFAFYAKKRGPANHRITRLSQIQPGLLADSPESTDVSQQLGQYIKGTAVELLTTTTPNTVILRTDGSRLGWFLYTYLDSPDGSKRLLDAWSRWEWSAAVGYVLGFARTKSGDILAFMVKNRGTACWIACERFTLASQLSAKPYLDSLRPWTPVATGFLAGVYQAEQSVAFGEGSNAFFGGSLSQLTAEVGSFNMAGAYVGVGYSSYVTPTNPVIRDRNQRPVTYGRLTLSSVKMSVAQTGGCTVEVSHIARPTARVLDFFGHIVGNPSDIIGQQPVVTTTLSAFVGGEVRECSYTIQSKRWLPLTITTLEWVGQVFNNTRRA